MSTCGDFGLGSGDMFGPLRQTFRASHKVIVVDLHGHGRTPLGARSKISFVEQGNDLAVLLDKLGIAKVHVLGYSMGAAVAFRLAVQHPAKVDRLALVSMGFASDGFYPEMIPMQASVSGKMADMMKDTPMYKSYAAIAPNPGEFPKLLDAIGDAMRQSYNDAEDVKKLAVPTILIFGDSDMFRLEHVVEFYRLPGGGQKDAGWQREHMAKNRLRSCRTSPTTSSSWRPRWRPPRSRSSTTRRSRPAGTSRSGAAEPQTSNIKRSGASRRSLTATRNDTASRPSTTRWSYDSATYIIGRT
ncbi:MAG TPA: alpha/beta hydrolase, partial [Kofleriaceae bacterium]|nr:alpha/beta hydrolase [Kofleriaceae bacterium]